jgi:hypothetical protein
LAARVALRGRTLLRGGVAYQILRACRVTDYDAGHYLEPIGGDRPQCMEQLALGKLASARDALTDPASVAFRPQPGRAVRIAARLEDTFKSLRELQPPPGKVARFRPLQGLTVSSRYPWLLSSPHLLVYLTPQGDDFDLNGRATAIHPPCQPHASIHVLLVR